jgi:hypothetical protein
MTLKGDQMMLEDDHCGRINRHKLVPLSPTNYQSNNKYLLCLYQGIINIGNILKKQHKTTQIKDSNAQKKTRFSLLNLGTKTTIFQNMDQNIILLKLEDQNVNT